MGTKMIVLTLLTLMIASVAITSAEVSVNQLEQLMNKSTGNISSYTFSKSIDSSVRYSNASIEKKFEVLKATKGIVDLQNNEAWWSSKLSTKNSTGSLNLQAYFVNGSEYLNIGNNWTKLAFNDKSRINYDFNEIPGQIALIENSDMNLSGSSNLNGVDYYKLVGRPNRLIYNAMIDRQILTALFASPVKLPEKLKNQSFSINQSKLINNSNIEVTAWISKDNSLLKRLDINSSSTINPRSLNISLPDLEIETILNESTTYSNFSSPIKIELPKNARNDSAFLKGAAWSRAVLGSIISANKP